MSRLSFLSLLVVVVGCGTVAPHRPVSPEARAAWSAYRASPGGGIDADDRLAALLRFEPPLVAAHRVHQDRLVAAGRGHEAYERYRARMEASPESARAWYLHGRLLRDRSAQESAFRRAVELDPGLSWGHHGLGAVLWSRGEVGAARASFRRAAGLAPSEGTHLRAFAAFEFDQRRLTEARRLARRALWTDPDDAFAWWVLARVHAAEGAERDAVTSATRAVRLAPTNPAIRAGRARLVLEIGTEAELRAVARFEQAARLAEGESAKAAVRSGRLALRLGEADRAVRELTRAIELGAPPIAVRVPLRRATLRTSGPVGALVADARVIPERLRRAPSNVLADRWTDATRAAAAAQERPDDPDACAAVAVAFARLGWLDEARWLLLRVIARDPEHAAAAAELSRVIAATELIQWLRDEVSAGYDGRAGGVTSVTALLERADAEFERLGLAGRPSDADRHEYPFMGEMVDESSALHVRLLEMGHLLVLGHRNGGPVEAVVMEAIAVEPNRTVAPFGEEIRHRREIGAGSRIGSARTRDGGRDFSGLALDDVYYLNLDEIGLAAWKPDQDLADSDPLPLWIPRDPADRRNIFWPGDLARRLAATEKGEPLDVALDVTAKHEEGHLVDARRFLPIHAHLPRAVSLAVSFGFSGDDLQAWLEGNAQLVALATATSPRTALRHLVSIGASPDASPPHSRGYHEALRELVERVAAAEHPRLDPKANVLQQLDRLSEEEIREFARAILGERGIGGRR